MFGFVCLFPLRYLFNFTLSAWLVWACYMGWSLSIFFYTRIAKKQLQRNENRVSADHCRVHWFLALYILWIIQCHVYWIKVTQHGITVKQHNYGRRLVLHRAQEPFPWLESTVWIFSTSGFSFTGWSDTGNCGVSVWAPVHPGQASEKCFQRLKWQQPACDQTW